MVETLGFSIYSIISSLNSNSFTSSCLIWRPFIFLSCVFVLCCVARTSNTMLNKEGKSEYPCLFPNFRVKPIIQSEVSQKEKHQYSILMHIYGI